MVRGMPRKIGMVHFSRYPEDVRPRREAEALVDAGFSVDTVCLRGEEETSQDCVGCVRVYRVNQIRKGGGQSRYVMQYLRFILLSSWKLWKLYLSQPYDIIHVHNMPDILVVAALLPKLFGAKVILDLHDPMPELFMTIYGVPRYHIIIKVLKFLEKFSIALADVVITPNISFRARFMARGCPAEKIHIVMNCPPERYFHGGDSSITHDQVKEGKRFILMYHGLIAERCGLDTAIQAVARLRGRIPRIRFNIYGDGDYLDYCTKMVKEKSLDDIVHFFGKVSWEEIVAALRKIDVGIISNKRTPFTEINLPTRILECLSMGKPVIAPRTQGILDYFDAGSLYFFEPGDPEDLARKVMEVYSNPFERESILQRGKAVFQRHRWESEKQRLVEIVRGL
jgi:glycosyltransferase involved in cell wall biosynthesis